MNTIDLIKKYRHVLGTDWTADPACKMAYLMNVNEDPLTDESGEGCTGNRTGGTFVAEAKYGGGYSFDGINDEVDCGAVNELNPTTNDFSWVCWGKIDDYSGEDEKGALMSFLGETGWSSAGRIELAVKDSDGKIYFEYQHRTSGVYYNVLISSLIAVDDGTWKHYCGVFDTSAGKAEFFVNGVSQGTDTDTHLIGKAPNAQSARRFTLAYRDYAAGDDLYFDGTLDEPAVFIAKLLDSTDANSIMDNGLKGDQGEDPFPLLRKDFISGYHCFMSAYINAKIMGYDPLKLPDGTTW